MSEMGDTMTQMGEILVPHVGWLRHEAGDDVALFLQQGWFEAREQAFLWLYLRADDVVLDVGAHVGLFSVLAGRAVGSGGRVIAFEPEATTANLLRSNLSDNGIAWGEVVEAAVADQPGRASLHRSLEHGGEGRSAYNTLVGGDQTVAAGEVAVVTIDGVLAERKIDRASFMKLDVEGAELNAWRGAAGTVQRRAIGVVMIEFTEQNLKRAGHSTAALRDAVRASGYELYRFDTDALQLVPAEVEDVIWYDNLFATADVEAVNARLRETSEDRRRIAREILTRAKAGATAQEAEDIKRHFRELEEARDAALDWIERLKADLQQQIARAEHSEKSHEKTGETLKQTQTWLRQMTDRATFLEQKLAVSVENEKRLNEQLEETRQLVRHLRQQLFAFVTSKYEQMSWKLGIRKKPDWVDAFVEHQLKEMGQDPQARP